MLGLFRSTVEKIYLSKISLNRRYYPIDLVSKISENN